VKCRHLLGVRRQCRRLSTLSTREIGYLAVTRVQKRQKNRHWRLPRGQLSTLSLVRVPIKKSFLLYIHIYTDPNLIDNVDISFFAEVPSSRGASGARPREFHFSVKSRALLRHNLPLKTTVRGQKSWLTLRGRVRILLANCGDCVPTTPLITLNFLLLL